MQLLSWRNNLLFPHNNEILAKTNTLSASVSVDAQVPWRYIFPARIFTGARFSIYFVVLAEWRRNYDTAPHGSPHNRHAIFYIRPFGYTQYP